MTRPRRVRMWRRFALATVAGGVLASACSSSGSSSSSAPSSVASSSSRVSRPSGPAADLSHRLTAGNGTFLASPVAVDLGRMGYSEREYLATGTAVSYRPKGALTADGRWSLVTTTSAPYRTRIDVRYPSDPSRFSGTVVVEWLNVSGGLDADPEWASLYEEIVRRGDAWVGVSAQDIGVMGGPVLVQVTGVSGGDLAGKGLRAIDPARYGTLYHPGDSYSYDIFTQVARGLRTGAALNGQHPRLLIAAGESQSAFAMVTYYDGVQTLTHEFDGFFVHSRGATGLPVQVPGRYADIAGSISGQPVIFRTDQAAPVLDLQSETDVSSVLNSYAARQPDSPHLRLWEVAGTSHADAHLIGPLASLVDCGVPINDGPMHLVAKAALRALTTWLQRGRAPVTAPRLEVTSGAKPAIDRNADGIALGGIRTPLVDVPVATLSGVPGPNPSVICLLLGSTKPFTPQRLAELYPTRAAYLAAYKRDAARTIRTGFVLADDRAALMAYARPSAVPAGAPSSSG